MKTFLQQLTQTITLVSLGLCANYSIADDSVWIEYLETPGDTADLVVDIQEFNGDLFVVTELDFWNGEGHAFTKYSLNGEMQWQIPETEGLHSDFYYPTSLEVNENGIFISDASQVIKLSHDGVLEWAISPTERLNIIVDVAGNQNGLFYAIDGYGGQKDKIMHIDYNGEILWTTTIDNDPYSIQSLIVENDVIFAGYGRDVHLYNAVNGNELVNIDTQFHPTKVNIDIEDMVFHDNAVYLYFWGFTEKGIAKFDDQGALLWVSPFFTEAQGYGEGSYVSGLVVNEEGIYVAGVADIGDTGYPIPTLAQYSHDGDLQSSKILDLPHEYDEFGAFGTAGLVSSSGHYILGMSASDASYIAEINIDGGTAVVNTPKPTQTLSLGDINSDGMQEVAVLFNGDSSPAVQIASVGGSTATYQPITFTIQGDAADIIVIEDQNDNDAPEIALLASDSPTVEVRDSLSGELLQTLKYVSSLSPVKIKAVADINNNSAVEIALLANNGDSKLVMVKDSRTGEKISTAYFNRNYELKDFAIVEDLNGDTHPELAVLSTNSSGISKFEVRTLTGQKLQNIWLGKAYESTDFLPLPYSKDPQTSPANALGALQTKVNGNGLAVRVMDVITGSESSSIGYNWRYTPAAATVISGTAASGKIAVLGSDDTNTKIEIRDAYSGALSKNIWLGESLTPISLTTIPDVNGNGEVETVSLVKEADSYFLIVRDSLTGALVDKLSTGLN